MSFCLIAEFTELFRSFRTRSDVSVQHEISRPPTRAPSMAATFARACYDSLCSSAHSTSSSSLLLFVCSSDPLRCWRARELVLPAVSGALRVPPIVQLDGVGA